MRRSARLTQNQRIPERNRGSSLGKIPEKEKMKNTKTKTATADENVCDLLNLPNSTAQNKGIETMSTSSPSAVSHSHNREPPTKRPKVEVKSEDNQDDSKENVTADLSYASDSDDMDDSFNYLKMREKNMKANEDFFASLGMDQAKEILQSSAPKKKTPSQRGLTSKKEPKELPPPRQSLRLRRIDPLGNALPDPEPTTPEIVISRLPAGPVNMSECAYSKTEAITEEFVKAISAPIAHVKPQVKPPTAVNLHSFQGALDKVFISENRVLKVVPGRGRVYSVIWHPSPQTLLTVAGDLNGHIGIWDVAAGDNDGTELVRAFKPHCNQVSDLCVLPETPHKLDSCSFDSTLRCGDFEKEVFDEIFSVPEENDDLFRNMSFIDNSKTMLVSHFRGFVSLVDTRTPGTSAEYVYPISKKSLRTVSVHPRDSHYFITAGTDTNINLWDLRSIKTKSPKPIQTLGHHTKAIASAYFSPSGHRILSCGADDLILVYSCGQGMNIDLSTRIRHNNHTGRWLTKFRPIWHPAVEDVFISGSMNRPREIQVFNADGSLLRALMGDHLGSVCSLAAFHPYKTCAVVGANSSGRLHVFM